MLQNRKNSNGGGSKRKRKLENLRFSRKGRVRDRHKLEVNPPSRMASKQRLRERIMTGFKLAICCCLAFFAVAGVKAGVNKLFFENPEFRISQISVTTDGSLTRTQILDETGLKEGEYSLGVDLEDTRRTIEALPQVISAEVQREMPGGIEIVIHEREPVAWLECEGLKLAPFRTRNGCLLAADGVAMPCHSLAKKVLHLPVIQVPHISRVKYGEVVDSKPVKGSLELIALNDKYLFEEQLGFRSIEAINPFSVVALFANDAEVTFGLENLESQMKDFKVIMDNAQLHGWRIATLNLMVGENIPVTFFSTPSGGFENPQEGRPMEAVGPGSPRPDSGGTREADARAILGILY